MSESSPRPYILVGIDGSSSALNALGWAAQEATLRNLPLRLVCAADYGAAGMGFNPGAAEHFFEYISTNSERFLEEARAYVGALDLDIEVTLSKPSGRPVPALVELSQGAFLTVVGSSGLNAVTGLLAGSVAVALAAHGHSPVVVVRSSRPTTGPVVVGVSGTPDSEDAINWAFEEASMRGAALIAVHSWKDLPGFLFYDYQPWDDLTGTAGAQQREMLLAERLAGWQEKFPDVQVQRIVSTSKTAAALLGHAQHAQLIVVGSRGRGDAAGLFLGSTSHRLIHHAACPVLVARQRA